MYGVFCGLALPIGVDVFVLGQWELEIVGNEKK